MMRLRRPRPLARRPSATVVIPCYNYGHYLADAVRSATDLQHGVDVEVIIVDDASPDGSGEIARRLADADPRVSLVQHEQNAGHLRTYNDGLRRATGEVVALVSADDMLAEGALARAAALMQHDPSVGFVYGHTDKFHDRPRSSSGRVRNWGVWPGQEWYDARVRSGTNPVLSPEVVMRRDLLGELGYYDLHLPHTADMFLWLKAAQRMNVGRVNGPVQAHYRMHEQQMHWIRVGWTDDLRERLECLLRAIDEDPDTSRRTEQRRAQVRRAVASDALSLAVKAYDQGRQEELPVSDLATLAAHVYPDIKQSMAWRTYVSASDGRRRPARTYGARGVRFARRGTRWLLRRQYGI
ncbi:glycosyltransferase family 2 protein [Nocardioides sp. P5_E3]